MKNKSNLNLVQVAGHLSGYSNIKYAVLFGSALKNLRKNSDIDILVGGELDFNDILELSVEAEKILKRKVDIVYADKAPARLVLKAMANGQKILMKDEEYFKRDYFKNLRIADDSAGLYRIREEKTRRSF